MKRYIFSISFSFLLLVASAQNNYNMLWDKLYGGTDSESVEGLVEVSSGGYLLFGQSNSSDGNVTSNNGEYDIWVVRLDSEGELLWQQNYGGSLIEICKSARETSDGGFILAGSSASSDHDVTVNYGFDDMWIVKIDQYGNLQWQRSIGTIGSDQAYGIEVDVDGYIVVGYCGQVLNTTKLNLSGTTVWQKNYTVAGYILFLTDITKHIDGNFLLTGEIVSGTGNDSHCALLKIDGNGGLIWQRTFMNISLEEVRDIITDQDGNILIGGVTYNPHNYYVLKTNPTGQFIWEQTFGYPQGGFWLNDINLTENGYIVTGEGNVLNQIGIWNLLLNEAGDLTDSFFVHDQFPGGGYTVAGPDNTFFTASRYMMNTSNWFDFAFTKTCRANSITTVLLDSTYCPPGIVTATEGFTSYRWTKGTIYDSVYFTSGNPIEVFEGGTYNVTAYNSFGCPSYASIVVPDPLFTPQKKDLCFVTIDELSGKNKVIFSNINPQSVIDSIYVYRTNESNQHVIIGRLGMNDTEFTDLTSVPAQQPYTYSVANLDTCGLIVGGSQHTTLLLQANIGTNNDVNLSWNSYIGINYDFVEIYRRVAGETGFGEFIKIAQLPAGTLSYADLNPPAGNKQYQLRITPPQGCAPENMQLCSNIESTSSCVGFTALLEVIHAHCGATDGSISAVASGGIAPYTYLWSGYITGAMLLNVPAGIYHLLVTDNLGCTFETLVTVMAIMPVAWAESLPDNPDTPSCDGKIVVHVSNAIPPYTYMLDGTPVIGINDTLYNVCAGQHHVTVYAGSQSCEVELDEEVLMYLPEGTSAGLYRIYPVPAEDKVFIEFGESSGISASATLYTAQGVIVSTMKFSSAREHIDISTLKAGIYFLKVDIAGKVSVGRIVKK